MFSKSVICYLKLDQIVNENIKIKLIMMNTALCGIIKFDVLCNHLRHLKANCFIVSCLI